MKAGGAPDRLALALSAAPLAVYAVLALAFPEAGSRAIEGGFASVGQHLGGFLAVVRGDQPVRRPGRCRIALGVKRTPLRARKLGHERS